MGDIPDAAWVNAGMFQFVRSGIPAGNIDGMEEIETPIDKIIVADESMSISDYSGDKG